MGRKTIHPHLFRPRSKNKANTAIKTNPTVNMPSAAKGVLNVSSGLTACIGTGVAVFKLPAGRGVRVGGAGVGVRVGVWVGDGVALSVPVTVGVNVDVNVNVGVGVKVGVGVRVAVGVGVVA